MPQFDLRGNDTHSSLYYLIRRVYLHKSHIILHATLVFQGSRNRGNFLELIKLLASYNEDVGAIVLENAFQNAQYVITTIQKVILSILTSKIQGFIQKEIGDSKVCIIVDEACDESKKEQNGNYDIHGQGYDGATNMFAYYVLCLVYRLQLTPVVASKEVIPICQFFSYLTDIEASHIAELIDNGELETGKGKNQAGTLQPSLNSLIRMFNSVCVVLQDIIKFRNLTQRSEADEIYNAMTSVDFVFTLHFLIEMLGIIDDLCLALQYKSQDILNAIQLVSSTKMLLQKLREHGWDPLFEKVKLFCRGHEIERNNLTIEHHYRFDIFITSIGSLLIEMNYHFNDEVMELLVLSYVFDPHNNYNAFWVEDIYKLMNDFYPNDFTKQEKLHMKIQLEHFRLDAQQSTELQKASTVVELCQVLAYSAMKIVKTRLRNRMKDNFLSTYLVAYIKKEIAREFSTDSIVDEFNLMKKRKVQFRMPSIEKWTKLKFF
ncbi:hypothetical protein V6Z11_D09G066400 [Gossypium hirsutum]